MLLFFVCSFKKKKLDLCVLFSLLLSLLFAVCCCCFFFCKCVDGCRSATIDEWWSLCDVVLFFLLLFSSLLSLNFLVHTGPIKTQYLCRKCFFFACLFLYSLVLKLFFVRCFFIVHVWSANWASVKLICRMIFIYISRKTILKHCQ